MDKLEVKRLKKELDTLCKKYPGINSDSLHKHEESHEYVNTHGPHTYGRFKDQSRAWFDLVNQIIIGLNYIEKKKWPKHRALQLLFVIHNVRTIFSATDRLLKSHWEDSLILCRVSLEALVRIVWISCHPDRSYAGILKAKEGKQFNFTGFVKDELKLEWDSYEFLSKFAHGNQVGVLMDWMALHRGTKKYPIVLERLFDEKMFELCINYIGFLEVAYLLFLTEVFITGSNKSYLPVEIVQDARKLARAKQKSMRSHPRNYWPQVANDLDDLIKLVQDCDEEGPSYKKHWKKIRDLVPIPDKENKT